MLNVLLYILVMALMVILVLVIFAAARPNEFSVRRSISIRAADSRLYGLIADFREWRKWSPWERLDPSGAENGKGAVYAWEGNKKVGAGRMEIVDAQPFSRIDIKLNFLRPFKAENRPLFTLVPAGEGTDVTWEMTGTHTLISKIMGMLMSMDKMVGRDFEKGLIAMKAEAEGPA